MRRICFMIGLLALASACSPDAESDSKENRERQEEPPEIFVVNYPLAYFADRIAGDAAVIRFPAPHDIDPAFWMPSPEAVAEYQRAAIILLNGAQYAKWVDRVSLPASRLVRTSAAFDGNLLATSGSIRHTHGPQGDHDHAGTAFTTWIDFSQAAKQADAVKQALLQRRIGVETVILANHETLAGELEALDGEMMDVGGALGGMPLIASHPVYDYLARRYGLEIKSVLWEPDRHPQAAEWAHLTELLRAFPARWMVWESEPLPETRTALERLGMGVVVFDPAGNRPSQGDFMDVMRKNVAALRAIGDSQ